MRRRKITTSASSSHNANPLLGSVEWEPNGNPGSGGGHSPISSQKSVYPSWMNGMHVESKIRIPVKMPTSDADDVYPTGSASNSRRDPSTYIHGGSKSFSEFTRLRYGSYIEEDSASDDESERELEQPEINFGDEVVRYRVSWRDGVSIRASPNEESLLLGVLRQGRIVRCFKQKGLWVQHDKGWSPLWDPYCEVVMMRPLRAMDLSQLPSGHLHNHNKPHKLDQLDIIPDSKAWQHNLNPNMLLARGEFLSPELLPEPLPPPLPLFTPTIDTSGLPNHLGLPMMPAPKLKGLVPKGPEGFFVPKGGSREDLVSRMRKAFLKRIGGSEALSEDKGGDGGAGGTLVYDSILKPPGAPKDYFEPKPNGMLKPYYVPMGKKDHTLVFESRFESGNLRRAIKVNDGEYDLMCRPDINTNSYAQWFFFRFSNTRQRRYRFNIVNMLKSDSLYNYGMQPCVYSEHDAEKYNIGWVRAGFDVCYYRNSKKYHTATFTVRSKHKNDTIYLAYCYPYSYSDLRKDLADLEADKIKKRYIKRRTLCRTILQNECDVLTITDFECSEQEMQSKRAIVASARVHPGESNASWMMKGLIEYLVSDCKTAAALRKRFLFKIVPMLNPDGVVLGNYRCGAAGQDLNRWWHFPNAEKHPTIHHWKDLIKQISQNRELVLSCDLHGHSKAMNVFMYGCNNNHNPMLRLEERVFPIILEKASPIFNFKGCHFKVRAGKAGSARVVVWRETNIINSFTMEASFAGSNFGQHAGNHFNVEHLMQMGRDWCIALFHYDDARQRYEARLQLDLMYPKSRPFDEDDESDIESDDSAEELAPDASEKIIPGMNTSCAITAKIRSVREGNRSNESNIGSRPVEPPSPTRKPNHVRRRSKIRGKSKKTETKNRTLSSSPRRARKVVKSKASTTVATTLGSREKRSHIAFGSAAVPKRSSSAQGRGKRATADGARPVDAKCSDSPTSSFKCKKKSTLAESKKKSTSVEVKRSSRTRQKRTKVRSKPQKVSKALQRLSMRNRSPIHTIRQTSASPSPEPRPLVESRTLKGSNFEFNLPAGTLTLRNNRPHHRSSRSWTAHKTTRQMERARAQQSEQRSSPKSVNKNKWWPTDRMNQLHTRLRNPVHMVTYGHEQPPLSPTSPCSSPASRLNKNLWKSESTRHIS